MTKRERLLAAANHRDVDRIPYGFWYHYEWHNEPWGDPLVAEELKQYRLYDPDLLKVMHDIPYEMPHDMPMVESPEDFKKLRPLKPNAGNFGIQLESLKRIVGEKGDDGVIINNIFNPLRYADRISRKRLKELFAQDKESVKTGLMAIAENLAAFSRHVVENGVDGIYLAAQGPEERWYPREEYAQHFLPYDKLIFDAVADAPFNIIHPHAEGDVYFDLFAGWGAQAICWSCRVGKPSISEARATTRSALCTGLDEARFHEMTADEIIAQSREAIAEAGRKGFILSPGCTVNCQTPEGCFRALIQAAQES